MNRWMLLVATVLSMVASAHGATYRVEQRGGGDFLTIQEAIDAAASGDTVIVGPGVYRDTRPFQSTVPVTQPTVAAITQPEFTLIGVHRDSVVIDPRLPEETTYDEGLGIGLLDGIEQDVTIRSLTVAGALHGVRAYSRLLMEDVRVVDSGFSVWCFTDYARLSKLLIERTDLGIKLKVGLTDTIISQSVFQDANLGVDYFQTLGRARVEFCEFRGGRVAVNGGFGSLGSIDVEGIRTLAGAEIGIYFGLGSSGHARGNVLQVTGNGIQVDTDEHVVIERNHITGSGFAALYVRGSCDVVIRDNAMDQSNAYGVRLDGFVGASCIEVDARSNYWGTTNSGEIHRSVYDANDDSSIAATVRWFPALSEKPVNADANSLGSFKSRFRN